MKRILTAVLLGSCVLVAAADEPHPDTGAYPPAQAAADVLRTYASADVAFLAADLVEEKTYSKDNLATLLRYPTDDVMVVGLTGAQIRQALERSLSLYPQTNNSFLQLSGMDVTFSKSKPSGSRVVSVNVDSSKIEDGKTYSVAMPSSLARGALGYFKIWDKSKIIKTFPKVTMEDVLKGKHFAESSPRWQPQA